MFTYGTHALRSVLRSMNSVPLLPDGVWSSLKELGLNKSPRWRRGGISNRQRIQARSVPSVNNAVLKVNNLSSIPVRITDRSTEKPCLDSKKPLQKNSSRNLLNLSKLRKVTDPPTMRCCFLNCHSLNGDKRPASIVDLILENSIQCLCLCEIG